MGSEMSLKALASSNLSQLKMEDSTRDYLERCKKVLALHVGPMAKIFVKEAVFRLATNGTFHQKDIPQLIVELEKTIEDDKERAQFRSEMSK